jgi:hypothetical protein
VPSRNLQQSVYNNSQWILFHPQSGNFSFMPSGFLLQLVKYRMGLNREPVIGAGN